MEQCHDCGCNEGETHLDFCDMERCFKCGGQLMCDSSCYPIYPDPKTFF